MRDRIYFKPHPYDGTFIAIRHGETGYYPTTVYAQDHADELNTRQGITPAEIEAAELCSMFGAWNRFDNYVETFAS